MGRIENPSYQGNSHETIDRVGIAGADGSTFGFDRGERLGHVRRFMRCVPITDCCSIRATTQVGESCGKLA